MCCVFLSAQCLFHLLVKTDNCFSPILCFWLVVVCLGAKSHLTLCNTVDCSLPGSSVHGISQAKILEWVLISFSRGSSQTRDQTWVSCLGGGFFITELPGKPPVFLEVLPETIFQPTSPQTEHMTQAWPNPIKGPHSQGD